MVPKLYLLCFIALVVLDLAYPSWSPRELFRAMGSELVAPPSCRHCVPSHIIQMMLVVGFGGISSITMHLIYYGMYLLSTRAHPPTVFWETLLCRCEMLSISYPSGTIHLLSFRGILGPMCPSGVGGITTLFFAFPKLELYHLAHKLAEHSL